jgi:hypothetical protein
MVGWVTGNINIFRPDTLENYFCIYFSPSINIRRAHDIGV